MYSEKIIVLAVVVLAAIYVGRKFFIQWKMASQKGGKVSCSGCSCCSDSSCPDNSSKS